VLPDDAISRFRADLNECTGGRIDARFGLCVSGGPDSVAMLLLAQSSGIIFEAATVNHGLRTAAASEAEFVATLCAQRHIRHDILSVKGPKTGNESAWARAARYAALSAWADAGDLDFLLTAHHADDQLETMMMRLNRGSGVGGLAGVRARNGRLARPLLGWRKSELAALVARADILPVDDPSNHNDRYDRARLRKALAQTDWLDPVSASRSAAALADADYALNWAADAYLETRVKMQNGIVSFDPRDLPKELLRRLVVRCLQRVDPSAEPRGDALERLIQQLRDDGVATLGGVKCAGGAIWCFTKEPSRRKN
jgi:tRNA(Ile)-lysidine synthase